MSPLIACLLILAISAGFGRLAIELVRVGDDFPHAPDAAFGAYVCALLAGLTTVGLWLVVARAALEAL